MSEYYLTRRRVLWWGWILCAIFFASLVAFPLRTTLTRTALLLSLAVVWGGLIGLTWNRVFLRTFLILVPVGIGVFALLPIHPPIRPAELRESYVRQLKLYENTRYFWGGENMLGIDCSGLVRAGMVDALLVEGCKSFNPSEVRAACSLWWHDENAIQIGKGFAGTTIPFGGARTLSDNRDIRPGDLAVTTSGSHVLAYLGGDRWIEAEPSLGYTHVFSLQGPFEKLAGEQVNFVRWKWLAADAPEQVAVVSP